MFRNYLAAALRNLVRNRLYAAINIVGLTLSFAAALLIALFVRDEFSYEKWIPGYESVYRISQTFQVPGTQPDVWDELLGHVSGRLKQEFSQIEATARLAKPDNAATLRVRGTDIEYKEQHFYWADPEIFDVFPLPVIAGDIGNALRQPNGVVITRKIAQKYFDSDAPLGAVLELGRQHPMTVTAVIEDLPSNTHLDIEIMASGLAPFSPLTRMESSPSGNAYTYLRLKSGGRIDEIRAGLSEFIDRHTPPMSKAFEKTSDIWSGQVAPIADIHLRPPGWDAMKPAGDKNASLSIAGLGILIVIVAGINFINLMTARASRRAIEIGVRKVSGAERRDLVLQFIGEALIYVLMSLGVAVIVVRLALPTLNADLGRTILLEFWRDPQVLVAMALTAVTVGVLAGFYPAVILSALSPMFTLKAGAARAPGRVQVRYGLVIAQLAALIGLIVGTGTIWRQTTFAMTNNLRLAHEQVVMVRTSCGDTLKNEIQRLEGVVKAACSHGVFADDRFFNATEKPDGSSVTLWPLPVDFDFFELYGIPPLAGKLFEDGRDAPAVLSFEKWWGETIILSKTATQKLGFDSPETAVGKPLPFGSHPLIIGVVDDYSLDSVRAAPLPTAYSLGHGGALEYKLLSIKLSGQQIPETLKAIDEIWSRLGEKPGPIDRFFVDQYTQELYVDLVRGMKLFTIVAGLTVFIATLGLFGLAAFTVETRTKEMGVRKALGANRTDIIRLLLWQFTKPVLWANVVAWPAAYIVMKRWLEGFAYHVDLSPWIFLAASALAVVIAVLTVAGHALLVARAQPVTALRYE